MVGITTLKETEISLIPDDFLIKLGTCLRKIHPKRALIFGSAVKKGLNVKDLDLIVLSDFFDDYYWQDRFKILDLPDGPSYDLRLFTPKEFEINYPRGHVFRESIEISNIDLEKYYAK